MRKAISTTACVLVLCANAAAAAAPAPLEHNKKLVQQFFQAVESRDKATVIDIVREDYIQHMPTIPTGRQAILNYIDMVAPQGPGKMPQIARMIAEDDLVAVHFRRDDAGGPVAAIEIFRIQDGRIAEHWAVTESFPAADKVRNSNGML
jgi:predicted SnoaL-like aldol condensation-catalyzing enzyme